MWAALREPQKRVQLTVVWHGSHGETELMERLIVKIISLNHIGTVFTICNTFTEISLNRIYVQNCSFQWSVSWQFIYWWGMWLLSLHSADLLRVFSARFPLILHCKWYLFLLQGWANFMVAPAKAPLRSILSSKHLECRQALTVICGSVLISCPFLPSLQYTQFTFGPSPLLDDLFRLWKQKEWGLLSRMGLFLLALFIFMPCKRNKEA